MLHEYTNIPIPASKKKLNINGLEVKDKKDFSLQWRELKKDYPTDKKLKTSFGTIVVTKAKDPANKNVEIYKDKDIQAACKG